MAGSKIYNVECEIKINVYFYKISFEILEPYSVYNFTLQFYLFTIIINMIIRINMSSKYIYV